MLECTVTEWKKYLFICLLFKLQLIYIYIYIHIHSVFPRIYSLWLGHTGTSLKGPLRDLGALGLGSPTPLGLISNAVRPCWQFVGFFCREPLIHALHGLFEMGVCDKVPHCPYAPPKTDAQVLFGDSQKKSAVWLVQCQCKRNWE